MKKINPSGSKTLYVGGIYEVDKASGGSVTRTVTYYPIASAMRINNTLYYILKDHLGSASVVTDASGTILGTQRYYPFGETRLTTGTVYTDKLFTGQREMAGLGIYHYQARFYSPKIGRFLSADTITPNPANPQNLNRFTYTLNNPIRYIDPSGHVTCQGANWDDGPQCVGTAEFTKKATSELRTVLKKRYNWNVRSDFTLQQLNTIYQTGRDIETHVDTLTGGKGSAWIKAHLGNTDFKQWNGSNNQTLPGWLPGVGENTIYLTGKFLTKGWIAHELGHIWDINTASATPIWGAVGGVADQLNTLVGGSVLDPKIDCRWCTGSGINHIPERSRYSGDAYGNNSTADYLAETFAFEIYPGFNPGGGIGTVAASNWVKVFIMSQALGLP